MASSLRKSSCLLLLILVAVSGTTVKFIPGFHGELPFELETGYVSLGDSEMFYYFIESQTNPKEDPLLLWLSGGPGCSSFNGLIYEIGPLEFDINNYTGGTPTLKYYADAWTKTASIIFLDSPVGAGFSYSTTPQGWYSSDSIATEQAYQFLRKWLDQHPEYIPLHLYIGGDSYSGKIVPLLTKKVVEGIDAGIKPKLNLMGYLVGSPATDPFIDGNSKITFAHRSALISDEIYESLRKSCDDNYVDIDPSNTECIMWLAKYEMCVKDLYANNILQPKCGYASPRTGRRSVKEDPSDFILSPPRIPDFGCQDFNYAISYPWLNDVNVQKALNVRMGIVKEWVRCNRSGSYTKDVSSVVDVHKYLSKRSLRVRVDVGDQDLLTPLVGTMNWIKLLNLTVVDEWRPWFIHGQVAGYTRKYSENGFNLTFATVKGAGHCAPEYYRSTCYEMFRRWIHGFPL